MSECERPNEPAQGDSNEAWAKYFKELAEYVECSEQESGGTYTGICNDISALSSAASTTRSKLNLVSIPPTPLPLTPNGSLAGLTTQMVAVASDAAAQDLSTQAGQTKAYQDCTWAMDWLKPASKSGTLAQLAGC